MKSFSFFLFFLFVPIGIYAQEIPMPEKIYPPEIDENYDFKKDTVKLEEIIISKQKLDPEAKKQFLILQSRVYRVYPYAKLASDRLTSLNKVMTSLPTEKEKKKYFKIVESYLTNEFEAQLKKLSRGQGRILIKLIHRQTGNTTYDLIKNLKSGWKAFWSNTTASMFSLNLKSEYQPFEVNEDYLIETILVRAFNSGRLQNQQPSKPVNIEELNDFWESKAEELKIK